MLPGSAEVGGFLDNLLGWVAGSQYAAEAYTEPELVGASHLPSWVEIGERKEQVMSNNFERDLENLNQKWIIWTT